MGIAGNVPTERVMITIKCQEIVQDLMHATHACTPPIQILCAAHMIGHRCWILPKQMRKCLQAGLGFFPYRTMIGRHMIANFKPQALQLDDPGTILWLGAGVPTIDRRVLAAHGPHRLGRAQPTVAHEGVHVSDGGAGGAIGIIKNGEREIFAVWPTYPLTHVCFLLRLRGAPSALISVAERSFPLLDLLE